MHWGRSLDLRVLHLLSSTIVYVRRPNPLHGYFRDLMVVFGDGATKNKAFCILQNNRTLEPTSSLLRFIQY